jgi:adenylate cyclase
VGLAATVWGAHSYFNSRGSGWLRRRPLILEIALRAFVMTLAISMVAVAFQVILYGRAS